MSNYQTRLNMAAAACDLKPEEFRAFNFLAEYMDGFHDKLRTSWMVMYKACTDGKRPEGMSIRHFLNHCIRFCEFLNLHHAIEEERVFPLLAVKMPSFRAGGLLEGQHHTILGGLGDLEAYVRACSRGERDVQWTELKRILDSFGEAFLDHLDEEVRELGAQNVGKYWTKGEWQQLLKENFGISI